ncbi:MAG TPA: mechanosensitive ion channel family protein [Thermoanaerobaculia bacterium]|nr:mechanosensitive ion channel family protein [Thermoanaerobaculia bacterium]
MAQLHETLGTAGTEPPAEATAVLAEGLRQQAELAENLRQGRWDAVLADLRDSWAELVGFLPLIALGLVVLLTFAWLARAAGRWQRPYRRLSSSPFVQELLRHTARTAIFIIGALFALEIVGATAVAAAVLGTAGVLGLAVGFAFRDVVENYIAGVLLSLRQPFEPNDHVVIEGHEGKVVRLTSRATILMTLDGNHLRIPNAQVFKGVILNYSRNPLRQFDFPVGIGPGEDLAEALRLGIAAVSSVPGVLADPEPWAAIEALGDSSVPVRYHGWLDQRRSNFALSRSEAIRRVKAALEAAGIELPEPTYRVRMEPQERPVREQPASPPAAPADLGAPDAIDRQIAEDRADARTQEDLLRPEAAKE